MSQPSPLTPARQRALALASSGDLNGARAVLERAVELGKVNLSEDDPDVLRTAYQLGTVLQRADDPSGARRVLEEAYAAGLWRLGDSDPLMLEISHDIGVVAEELGNRHEARKAFGRVAELGPGVLGNEHGAVVRARAYLGHDPVRAEPAPPLEEPTAPLSVVAGVDQGRGSVEPPSPADRLVWYGPVAEDPGRGVADSVGAPTAAQPFIAPRTATASPGAVEEGIQQVPPPRTAGVEAVAERGYPPESAVGRGGSQIEGGLGRTLGGTYPTADIGYPPPPTTVPGQHVYPTADTGYPPLPTAEPGQRPYPTSSGSLPGPAVGYPPGVRAGGHFAGAPVDDERGRKAYRKGLGLFAAIAAVMASVIAVAALVFVLADVGGDGAGGDGAGDGEDVPTLGGPPPSDVRLRDSGSGVEVRWRDPSDGTVSFMVAMGRSGEELKPVATLGPGQTSYELGGLNASLNYCFTVIAVYRSNQFATSPQTCTSRAPATPR